MTSANATHSGARCSIPGFEVKHPDYAVLPFLCGSRDSQQADTDASSPGF
jgi:hypothetical protein